MYLPEMLRNLFFYYDKEVDNYNNTCVPFIYVLVSNNKPHEKEEILKEAKEI